MVYKSNTIPDRLYYKAVEYAKKKQRYIYNREKREEVLSGEYLEILTDECIHSFALQAFTRGVYDLCYR